ncbi:MAG: type II toxin-antitoxin system VapC family toxin [Spirochaetaceae bacterium]|nr:MAG: type II toxin-antitoxin system VapC family toxin [Spirochaetaceae bacterium]
MRSGDDAVLLDTHALVWVLAGDERLAGSPALARIERASENGSLYVSVASLRELAVWEASGRVRFTIPEGVWSDRIAETPGLRVYPLDPTVAIEAGRLPGEFPGDVTDGFIVATARVIPAVLFTADSRLTAYAGHGFVSIFDLR